MKAVPYILGIIQGVGKEMAGSSHTPACYLIILRSSLEAGKEQPRVWQQYASSMMEMLLYPSFRVGFNPTFLPLGRTNAFALPSLNRKVTMVLLLSTNGDSEEPQRCNGCCTEVCALGNISSNAHDTGFVGLRSYVHELMNLCSCEYDYFHG